MNKDTVKNLALILLIGITIFSMIRYVSELKARFRLQDTLNQAQSNIATLAQEKQNLLQELGKEKEFNEQLAAKNERLRAYAKASNTRLTRLFQESSKTQSEFEDTSAKFAILKAENRALIASHKRSYTENEQLQLKLSSVVELKKAIRELRIKKPKRSSLTNEGNQGFIIKDGQSTLEKIKIEVIPAAYKSLQEPMGQAQTKE